MNVDEMKAELEAVGYLIYFRELVPFGERGNTVICTPDGEWESVGKLVTLKSKQDRAILTSMIESAYAHLQKERELAALRAYIWQTLNQGTLLRAYISQVQRRARDMFGSEPQKTIFDTADEIVKQFNIAEPDDFEKQRDMKRFEKLYPNWDQSDDESDSTA